MHFFNPLNLIWLLPMAGLIVLMYILKLRRTDVIVSSTMLWRQVIRDVQANAPFQKLRKNLLLLLQLIAVALLVFSLSRPFWRGSGIGGRSVVLVVDSSASMMATDQGRSRLDEAKRDANTVVSQMRPEDQMMVISAASRPQAESGFSGDKGELSHAINDIRPRETGTNMRDAVNLAAALVATRDASEIDIFSDGAFPPVTNVNLGKAHVVFHPVGKASHNVGIAAVDYRRSLAGEKKVQVFVTVHNYDSVGRTFDVELHHDKDLLDAHEVNLAPGAEDPDIFEIPEPAIPVTLEVRLDVKDDLAADNRAYLAIAPRKPIKALLVTAGNTFLETGIRVDPNVALSIEEPAGFRKPDGYDAVIFDGQAPKTLPEGNYLFVDCMSNHSPADVTGVHEGQSLIDPGHTHPVMRYVDFGGDRWTDMRSGRPRGWAQDLADSESGPAIIAGEKGRMRALWVGFDLDLTHGKFPLTVGYPIFVSNAIRWLAHAEDTTDTQVRTGTPVTLDAPQGTGSLTVTRPDGSKRDVSVPSRGQAAFDDTDLVGVYAAAGPGGYRRVFAANLADYAESDIMPRRNPDLGGNPPGQVGRRVTVTREIWPWLALLLLVLLAAEWYAFHRRVWVS